MLYSSHHYQFPRVLYTCSITALMLYCNFNCMLYRVFLVRLSIVVSLDLRQYLTLNGYLAGMCSMTLSVK